MSVVFAFFLNSCIAAGTGTYGYNYSNPYSQGYSDGYQAGYFQSPDGYWYAPNIIYLDYNGSYYRNGKIYKYYRYNNQQNVIISPRITQNQIVNPPINNQNPPIRNQNPPIRPNPRTQNPRIRPQIPNLPRNQYPNSSGNENPKPRNPIPNNPENQNPQSGNPIPNSPRNENPVINDLPKQQPEVRAQENGGFRR